LLAAEAGFDVADGLPVGDAGEAADDAADGLVEAGDADGGAVGGVELVVGDLR
jgi:hypothetical protein